MRKPLTETEKQSILKMSSEDVNSRTIALRVLGSETRKSTVNDFLSRHKKKQKETSSEESTKTFLTTDEIVKQIAMMSMRNKNTGEVAEEFDIPEYLVKNIQDGKITEGLVEGEAEYYQSIKKKAQKGTDMLRIERKVSREANRISNAQEELVGALVDVLTRHSMKGLTKTHARSEGKPVGVIHLSDLHFGETVIEVSDNLFDLEVAAARLKKHVDRAKVHFNALGITDVLIACTADLVNSDRRLDEVISNASNRANILFSAVDTLQQLILDVNEDFNVTVASVCGNESRIGKDVGWTNLTAADNFDAIIHNMLSRLFKDSEGVRFIDMIDPLECVVEVNGTNFLLIHGHNGLAVTNRIETEVAKQKAKYSSRGIDVDYVICGHIHSAMISDLYARSSGLPGGNSYSDKALGLTSRASQNLYIVYPDKSIDGIKVDLQEFDVDNAYQVSDAEDYRKAVRPSTVTIQSVII